MLKIEKDLKSTKDPTTIAIANYLIETSKDNKLIADTLNKENKSIEGMISYVRSEAQKFAVAGMAHIDDPTVYGWAQHYYDEDSIGVEVSKPKVKVESKPINLPSEDLGAFDI